MMHVQLIFARDAPSTGIGNGPKPPFSVVVESINYMIQVPILLLIPILCTLLK